MTSYTLFQSLVERGFWLEVTEDGSGLYVTPRSKLTDKDKEFIAEFKSRLIVLLGSLRRMGEPCVECGWDGLTFDGRCQIHFDIQVLLDRGEYECLLQEDLITESKPTKTASIKDRKTNEKNSRSNVQGLFR